MLQLKPARATGLLGGALALLLTAGLALLLWPPAPAEAQEEKPPPVVDLTCTADTKEVVFRWKKPSWSGGEVHGFDYDLTSPSGKREGGRGQGLYQLRREGNWEPGKEARLGLTVVYIVDGNYSNLKYSDETVSVCVVPGEPPAANNPPTVASAMGDVTILNQSGTHEASLSGVFNDADGDDLTITATSSEESVATVSVAADYATLTVTAKARGTATVTVTAADGKGGRVSDEFSVKVKAAPAVASPISDVSGLEVDDARKISLSGVFTDADGDALTVTAASSKDAVAAVVVATDQSGLTLTGKSAGTATVTVTAQDSDGNSVSDAFDVTVVAKQPVNNPPTVASAMGDVTIVNQSGTSRVSLSGVFTDADQDSLTVTATSSAEAVATVSVAADYSKLTVTAKARGTATITATAADGRGGSVEDTFTVTVKVAPVVASALADITGLNVKDTRTPSLAGVFSDADGDAVTVTRVQSSDTSKVSILAAVATAADGSISITGFTLTAVDSGTATITVTAQDSDGNRVSDAFDVTVVAATLPQQARPIAATAMAPAADAKCSLPADGDYDADDDGLIEVCTVGQLKAIHWDLDGDGSSGDGGYGAAYPNAASGMGCPSTGCIGYELVSDLSLGYNRFIPYVDSAEWTNTNTIGVWRTDGYAAIFEGNGHTIGDYWASASSYMGLFSVINAKGVIRNLRLESVRVSGRLAGGGLAGINHGTISNVHVVSGRVSSFEFAGGLVGRNGPTGIIRESSSAAETIGVGLGGYDVGSLVGRNDGSIVASYATGRVWAGNEGEPDTPGRRVGGLAGNNYGEILASYSMGRVLRGTVTGGLVAHHAQGTTTDNYWDTETSGRSSSATGQGKTTAELQYPTGYTGIYANWNLDLDGDGSPDDPWDFGASNEYPVLKRGIGMVAPTPQNDGKIHVTGSFDHNAAGVNGLAVGTLNLPPGVKIVPEFQPDHYDYQLTVPAEMDQLTIAGRFDRRATILLRQDSYALIAAGGSVELAQFGDGFHSYSDASRDRFRKVVIAGSHETTYPRQFGLPLDGRKVIRIALYKIPRPVPISRGSTLDHKMVYTFTVTRGNPSANANLSSLRILGISAKSLGFDPATTAYAVEVPHMVDSLTLTPVPVDHNATVTVNGENPSTPVELDDGKNAINVVVTSADGMTTRTYVVTVTRAASPDPDAQQSVQLSPDGTVRVTATLDRRAAGYDDLAVTGLALPDGVAIEPAFQSDRYSYWLTVPADVEQLTFAGRFRSHANATDHTAYALLAVGDMAALEAEFVKTLRSGRNQDLVNRMLVANSWKTAGTHQIQLPPGASTVIEIGVYKSRIGQWMAYYRAQESTLERKVVYTLTVTRDAPPMLQQANNVPTVASGIDDVTIVKESGTSQVSLSGVFADADEDSLTVTASSSNEAVAAASVSADYATLTVTAKTRGTATITVTADDGYGGAVSDEFTVTVKAAPVVASAIADVSGLEVDATHKVSLSGVFSDADGDSLTVTAASSNDLVATVSVAADHSGLTLTGKGEGTAIITVTAQDSDGNRVSDAFDVTVIKANNPPTVASAIDDATIINESGTHEVSLSGVFTDADEDSLTITAESSSTSVATASVAADYSKVTVSAQSRGSATITVTTSDGNGGSVEDQFNVKVKAAPTVASPIADMDKVSLASLPDAIDLTKVFSDADGDTLTFDASSTNTGVAWGTPFQGLLNVFPLTVGTVTFKVTAQDSDGNRVSDAFDVTVIKANNPPTVANAISDATIVNESGTSQVSLSGVFTDADQDSLTITATSSDEKTATVSVSTDQATLTVTAKARGTTTITVTAKDGNGGSVEDSFTVTVKAAPVVAAAIADVSELTIDAKHEVSVAGVFSDADEDAITVTNAVSSDNSIAVASTVTDGSTSSVTAVTVIAKGEGTATITVTAQDSDGNSVSDAFDVTVLAAQQQQAVDLPGPVVSLELTASADNSVTVRWSAPESGGAPDGYIVHLRPENGKQGSGKTKRPKAKKTQVKFNNLQPGQTYEVWARAQNEAGKGERVHASITLPE